MNNNGMEICPACGVKIVAGDRVMFSAGPPGTRGRLWARVCQYAKKPGCINQNKEAAGEIKPDDYYIPPENLFFDRPTPEALNAVVSNLLNSTDNPEA